MKLILLLYTRTKENTKKTTGYTPQEYWWKIHSQNISKQNLAVYTKTYGIYWRRQWHPTPVLLPGKSHGRRSLVGCSPWGREESDMAERLHFHFSLLCIGEGNGNPLQCSCLENPRDGVAQSRTRLKWLSSSSRNGIYPRDAMLVQYLKISQMFTMLAG